ncbi:uncharacterized protein LOC118151603 [Callithrix jacchus]
MISSKGDILGDFMSDSGAFCVHTVTVQGWPLLKSNESVSLTSPNTPAHHVSIRCQQVDDERTTPTHRSQPESCSVQRVISGCVSYALYLVCCGGNDFQICRD